MSVQQWLSQWISLRRAGLAPRTIESYTGLLSRHIAPALGAVSVGDVKPADISALLADLCAAGHSRTAEQVFVLLRASLADAVRCGLLARSPMELVLRPRHYAQQRAYLASEDLHRLIRWCVANPGIYSRAWLLAAVLGLRRGEIAGLRWQDIDWRAQVVHIRQQRQPGRDASPPKSRSGIRDLPMPELLCAALRPARGCGYVVPVSPGRLDRQLPRDLVAAGVPVITLHGLRHSMATAAMQSDCNLRVLQSILGHSSPSTTAAVYCHVAPADQRRALDNFLAELV